MKDHINDDLVKEGLKKDNVLNNKVSLPSIRVAQHRNEQTGDVDGFILQSLQLDGMVIERLGRHYQVNSKGTQRRIS